jgi:transcriptional regulator with XRE-family HTH domain
MKIDLNITDYNLRTTGGRLRYLREFAHLERDEASGITGVAMSTYKDWENNKTNLPQHRGFWLIDDLQTRGIKCSLEWLLDGKGPLPSKNRLIRDGKVVGAFTIKQPLTEDIEQEQIAMELEMFCGHNINAVGFMITDNDMFPEYASGDFVGGIEYRGKDIQKVIDTNCIVRFRNGDLMLRRLQEGKTKGCYTLLATNRDIKVKKKIIHDVKLEGAAPVIWHRTRIIKYTG